MKVDFSKFLILLIAVSCVNLFCSCDKEDKEHNWQIRIPSLCVANGDYLKSSVYGSSDYDFNVNYYWDGKLILTSGKMEGLIFYINESRNGSEIGKREEGDHVLKIENTGEFNDVGEFIIQVYDKSLGFLGCNLLPNDRKVKNGQSLQGDVVFIPSSNISLYHKGWVGAVERVRVYIDDEGKAEKNAVQIISGAPFILNVPIEGLSKGKHRLTIVADGTCFSYIDSAGGVDVQGFCDYIFTVTE